MSPAIAGQAIECARVLLDGLVVAVAWSIGMNWPANPYAEVGRTDAMVYLVACSPGRQLYAVRRDLIRTEELPRPVSRSGTTLLGMVLRGETLQLGYVMCPQS